MSAAEILTGGSILFSGVSSLLKTQSQNQYYAAEAGIAQAQAEAARRAAIINARQYRQRAQYKLASARAAYLSRFDPSGTVDAVMKDMATQTEYDARLILYQGQLQSTAYTQAAEAYKGAMSSPFTSFLGGLVGGAAKALSGAFGKSLFKGESTL